MSGFEINSESINKIKSLVKRKNNRLLKKDLSKLHYADIAEIVELLSIENATYIIKLLESDKTADALAEIDEDLREKILDKLSSTEIADEIQKLNTDDAADLVAELPEDRKEKVLSQISDTEHLKDIRELLTYEENTAGGIMAKELVKIEENLRLMYDLEEVQTSYDEGVLKLHDRIRFKNPDYQRETRNGDIDRNIINTTVGRVFFNQIWPEEMGFSNKTATKKVVGILIEQCYEIAGHNQSVIVLDKLKNLGYEPLSKKCNAKNLSLLLHNKERNIKNVLMDQKIIAGLGNIYVCEALFKSGISPLLLSLIHILRCLRRV